MSDGSETKPAHPSGPSGRAAGGASKGSATRVSQVHAQARPTFALAALFALAAAITVPVHNRTGLWLPLHLFLVGSILGSIIAATQLLAVTWSSSPAPATWLADSQRVLLFAGAAAVAVGREIDSIALIGIGGTGVIAALALLIVSLVRIRRSAVTDRYVPAIWGYVAAASFGIVGVVLGAALASGAFESNYSSIRGVHLSANALGLVGMVIASTLPYFLATQARMKMSPTATSGRITTAITALAIATAMSLIGWTIGSDITAAAGAWIYAASLLGLTALFPRIGRKQLDWAGPRLLQMATGYMWWIISLVLLGVSATTGTPTLDRVLVLMVVGGYAQILSASLSYFAPVITSGKRKPGDGLRLTRSWVGLAASNVAAVGVAVGVGVLAGTAVVVWIGDLVYRLVRLIRFAKQINTAASEPS